jgi:hypothetical protein
VLPETIEVLWSQSCSEIRDYSSDVLCTRIHFGFAVGAKYAVLAEGGALGVVNIKSGAIESVIEGVPSPVRWICPGEEVGQVQLLCGEEGAQVHLLDLVIGEGVRS